ncbi:MAG: hypothetical protein CVU54_13550 [Deltaproteobacteria bacterium HGW-Deltaproteobacteria-12]|jgi:hypothetical protein|nr:MAG: hypothetical protein CVU54_13550 [Deltaproteobacteria bacterium HGW-Deltaproteobacteria-12]
MELVSWLPSLTTTGLLSAALWFGRKLILIRLTKSVQHEFNKKIEAIRAELRKSEESFKAQLREKEAEIDALRSGALSVLASRQAALDKRRLEAVDQLWSAFNALAPARAIAASMAFIKFESAAQKAERDPKVRQFFEMIGGGFDPRSIDLSGAAKARPFISPMAWAVFSAFLAVTMHSAIRLQVLKGGLGAEDFTDHKAIEKLVVAALPHYADYLEKNGPAVYYYVLEALEARLLIELQSMLSGSEIDKASLEQAAEIIRQANALQAATNEVQRAG